MNQKSTAQQSLFPFPPLTLLQCKEEGNIAALHFASLIEYLSITKDSNDQFEKCYFSDVNAEMTFKEYAELCLTACATFLSDQQITNLSNGFSHSLDMGATSDPLNCQPKNCSLLIQPFAHTAIFSAQRGPRSLDVVDCRRIKFKHPINADWFEYYGPSLRQDDLSVLLWFAKQNEGRRAGIELDFDAKQLLNDIGRDVHSKNLHWLFEDAIPALERASLVHHNSNTGQRKSYIFLKSSFYAKVSESGRVSHSLKKTSGKFRLDPDYAFLLSLYTSTSNVFLIDMEARRAVSHKPMALLLHTLLSSYFNAIEIVSQAKTVKLPVTQIKQIYYGEEADKHSDKEFSRSLKEAAKCLVDEKILTEASIWRGVAYFSQNKNQSYSYEN